MHDGNAEFQSSAKLGEINWINWQAMSGYKNKETKYILNI